MNELQKKKILHMGQQISCRGRIAKQNQKETKKGGEKQVHIYIFLHSLHDEHTYTICMCARCAQCANMHGVQSLHGVHSVGGGTNEMPGT